MAHPQRAARTPVTRFSDALVLGMALVVRWFLLLLLLVLPLDVYIVLPPHQSIAFLSQLLAAEGTALLACALVAARVLKKPPPFTLGWGDLLPLGVLLLVAVLSAQRATNPAVAAKGSLKAAAYLGIYLIARATRAAAGIRAAALTVLLVGGVLVLTAGFIGLVPNMPDFVGMALNIQRTAADLPNSGVVRAAASFRYPNELAAYLLLLVPMLLAFTIKAPSLVERFSYAALSTLGLGLLFLTYTRGAVIALLLVVPLVCLALGGIRALTAGIIVLGVIGAGLAVGTHAVGERYLSILSLADSGYTIRFAIWHWALGVFLTHPLLGVGLDNLALQPHAPAVSAAQGLRAVDAENLYLNVLAELGIVGFGVVLTVLAGAVGRTWRGLRTAKSWLDQGWNAGVLGGLAACLIYGLVDPVLVSGQVTGMLCLLVGLAGPLTEHAPPEPVPSAATSTRDAIAENWDDDWHENWYDESHDDFLEGYSTAPVTSRVVFLVNAHGFGGAEHHCCMLAEALALRGVSVLVICPPDAQFIPRLKDRHVPYRTMSVGMNVGRWRGFLGTGALFNPLSRRRLRHALRALATEGPTIFVCPFPREQILVSTLGGQSASKCIWVLHAPLHYLPHRLVVAPLLTRRARRAAALMAIAPRVAQEYVRLGIPSGLISVIPNAVSAPTPRAAAPTSPHPPRIGVAARLTRGKGVQYLIAAMPAIRRQAPAAELVIAGDGRYRRALERQAARLGLQETVRFVGFLKETEAFFRNLTVFVCPSVDPGEGLPTVVLEAMRAGVPVVATAVGGTVDLLLDHQGGVLVPPASAEDLAHAIGALIADPAQAQRLGSQGRLRVLRAYTADRAAGRFLRLVNAIERKSVNESLAGTLSGEVRAVRGKSLLKDTSALLISKVVTALATALWTVVAARSLLPAAYGDLMLCAALVELGAVITDAGLTAVATRDLAQVSPREISRYLGTLMYLKAGLGLVATAAVMGVTLLLPLGPEVRKLMLVLGPSLFFVALNSLSLVFRARMTTGYIIVAALIGTLVGVCGTLLVVWAMPVPAQFAAVRLDMVGAMGVSTLVFVAFTYRPSLAFDWSLARTLLKTSLLLGVALAINILYYRLDVPLLAVLTDTTQVAIYVSAYRILDVVTLLPAAAASVALPLMAAAQRDSTRHLATFCRQYLELAAACGLFVAVALTIFRAPLLALLYGGRYQASGPILLVLAWVAAATLITNVFMPLMVVLERQRTVLLATALALVVNVTLNFTLIPHLGAIAAAYATLATEIIVTAPLIVVATRAIHVQVVSRPLLAAMLGTAVALLANSGLHTVVRAQWAAGVIALLLWIGVLVFAAPRWVRGQLQLLRTRPGRAGASYPSARPPAMNYPAEGR